MRRSIIPVSALCLVLAGVAFWSWDTSEVPNSRPESTPRPLELPQPGAAIARAPEPLIIPVHDAGAAVPQSPIIGAAIVELDAGAPLGIEDAGSVAPGLPVELPALTLDAGTAERAPNDPRFGVRWGQAGLCGDEPLQRMAERRAALLASFVGVRRAGTLIFHDPDAPIAFVDAAGQSLAQARNIATHYLGPRADVALPVIYVYASSEQMRDVACVNTATQGYYDGAIHLPATDADAWRTVVHEHMHHVLNAMGLRKPMWFHEGLAMVAADERWWDDPRLGLMTWLRSKHLPFPALTEAFPHTADELFAGAAYYQSYEMVRFVLTRTGRADLSWFVDGVASGTFAPQTSFGDSVGLSGDQLESAWRGFVMSR
jgi:hypothetical protein